MAAQRYNTLAISPETPPRAGSLYILGHNAAKEGILKDMNALIIFIPNIINGVFLVVSIILSFIITRAGIAYSLNYGDNEAQEVQKWIILRAIVALVVVGLAATLFNIAQFFFE